MHYVYVCPIIITCIPIIGYSGITILFRTSGQVTMGLYGHSALHYC